MNSQSLLRVLAIGALVVTAAAAIGIGAYNAGVARGSAEEKQLLQRYTRQLDQQETRLDTLQTEIARIRMDMEKVGAELAVLLSNVSFDLTAP